MFFTRLKELCDEIGKSTTKVCAELGIPKTTVSYWRNNTNVIPKQDVLNKIANYFEVTTDYLLGASNQKRPLVNNDEELTEYLYELKTRPEMRMLFKLSSKATKEDVEQAVRIIEAIRNDKTDGESKT